MAFQEEAAAYMYVLLQVIRKAKMVMPIFCLTSARSSSRAYT